MVFFLNTILYLDNKQTACHFALTLYIKNINLFVKTYNYYYLGQ